MRLEIETQEELAAAIAAVEELRRRSVRHVGVSHGRTKVDYGGLVNREKIFSDQWRRENEGVPSCLNGGKGVLELIVCSGEDGRLVRDLTQLEAAVAATVVQWLGSNVGWCFLEQCVEGCGYSLVRRKTK
jgi:hypothetical protein